MGSEEYQKTFADFSEKYPTKMKIMVNDEQSKRKIYAAANISLIFNNNSQNAVELKNALAYGVIPIVKSDSVLKNYSPVTESGNAFLYKEDNKWLFYSTLVRALENFKFSYDWQNLELAVMDLLNE